MLSPDGSYCPFCHIELRAIYDPMTLDTIIYHGLEKFVQRFGFSTKFDYFDWLHTKLGELHKDWGYPNDSTHP